MQEKITVITGGCGGIGISVIKKFLKNGDKVIVLDVQEVKDEKIIENDNFLFIKTDVTEVEQIIKAKKIIEEKYQYIDNLISMAGVNMKSEIGGMKTITIDDIDKSIKLNLNSHMYLIKVFLDLLKKETIDRKTVTMISSINALADHGLPAYSAAKSGLYGLMKAISNEMAKDGIRVNTISLGTVPHKHEIIEGNTYFEEKLKNIAIKDFVRPKDVADTIYSLTYVMKGIVGHNIVLDMGQSVM